MVGADSHGIPRAPWYLGEQLPQPSSFHLRDFHPLWSPFPECSIIMTLTTPNQHIWVNRFPLPSYSNACRLTQHEFLALPSSLTTTKGITFVFFSWRYLDVSVPAVRFLALYIQTRITRVRLVGFPHSEIFGSKLDWQLPEAYSSLPLPSSPPDTKASTKCSFQLSTKLYFNDVKILYHLLSQTCQRSQVKLLYS